MSDYKTVYFHVYKVNYSTSLGKGDEKPLRHCVEVVAHDMEHVIKLIKEHCKKNSNQLNEIYVIKRLHARVLSEIV